MLDGYFGREFSNREKGGSLCLREKKKKYFIYFSLIIFD